jgi:ADP-ribosylation factor-like protein 4
VSLVLIGLDNVGKSTIVNRLKTGQYCETIPTVGFNCEKIKGRTQKTKDCQFTIWDLGGQERVRPLWRTYCKSAHGILFVVDSAERGTLEEAKIELEQMIKFTEAYFLPILILANKQDLPDAHDLDYLRKYFFKDTATQSQNLKTNPFMRNNSVSNSRKIDIISVCAITGEGLDEALELMYEMIIKSKSKNSSNSKK